MQVLVTVLREGCDEVVHLWWEGRATILGRPSLRIVGYSGQPENLRSLRGRPRDDREVLGLEGGTTVRGLVVLEAGPKFIVEPSGDRLACYDSAFTCLA